MLPVTRAIAPRAAVLLLALGALAGDAAAASPTRIALGAADGFAVLAATTVTSAGLSTIDGDIGVSPGTAITGVAPGNVTNGAIHAGDATAAAAHAALETAYGVAAGRAPATPVDGVLDGDTLTPGVYAAATMSLAGTLTLDAQGQPNAVFVLQAGSTLITAAASGVSLAGGAQSCNVFWQVGSSATLGASSSFTGTLLAHTSITSGATVAVNGRLLALGAAVTLGSGTIAAPHCAPMSNTAPLIAPFSATLSGSAQTLHAAVGAWSVTGPSDTDAGYRVTVAASIPTVDGSTSAAGTGGSLTLTPRAPVVVGDNPATTGPAAGAAQILSPAAATIATASANTGQGLWSFPADSGAEKSLAIVIPGDAEPGAYSSTLTFTTAPPAP